MITIRLLTEKDEEGWRGFVRDSRESTIYHTLEWKQVIEETYGYRPYYLIAEESNRIRGILPLFHVRSFITGNRLVSLPFSYLGGPLTASDEVMDELIEAAKSKANELGCRYLELRMQEDLSAEVVSGTGLLEDKYYISFTLRLVNNPDEIWGKLHKNSIRRSVKKARSHGVGVRQADSVQDLKSFYDLNAETRRRHGVPAQSFNFFERIWERMHPDLMDLLLAEYNNETVAAILLFTFRDTVLYAYGASDDRFLHLRPNNLLLWSAIESACGSSLQFFDFGRASPDEGGLVDFKRRWGAEERTLPYYYYPRVPDLSSSDRAGLRYRFLTGFWSKIPGPVSKAVGPAVLKHLG